MFQIDRFKIASSTMMVPSLTSVVFETKMTVLFSASVSAIVLSALFIVWILLQIELNKAALFLIDEDEVVGGDKNSLDLTLEESTASPKNKVNGLETEPEPKLEKQQSQGESSAGEVPSIKTTGSSNGAPSTSKLPKGRKRRLPKYFILMQIASVGVLVLLTYLLLVVSSAPTWLSSIGSLCVLGVFFRYQVGEELRRQRVDRLFFIASLFLVIAAGLSMATYAGKSLKRGEIYEGPARIVGYDYSKYSNSKDEPVTRTDLMVNWGDNWGCPESGGKICSAHVQGAMCQADQPTTDDRRRRQWRYLADSGAGNDSDTNSSSKASASNAADDNEQEAALDEAKQEEQDLEEDLEDEETKEQDLEEENEELEKENEELKEELEGTLIYLCSD